MKEEYGFPTFQIGDRVRVVDMPFRECPFNWVKPMDKLCGKEFEISNVGWSRERSCYYYCIKGRGFAFCKDCSVLPPDDDDEVYSSEGAFSCLMTLV